MESNPQALMTAGSIEGVVNEACLLTQRNCDRYGDEINKRKRTSSPTFPLKKRSIRQDYGEIDDVNNVNLTITSDNLANRIQSLTSNPLQPFNLMHNFSNALHCGSAGLSLNPNFNPMVGIGMRLPSVPVQNLLGHALFPGHLLQTQRVCCVAENNSMNIAEYVNALPATIEKFSDFSEESKVSSRVLQTIPRIIEKELSLPQDGDYLSEHQCLLRKNIEYFTATEEDLSSHLRGRNWKITPGQIGIRCKHCKGYGADGRLKSARYFPLTLPGIYQAAQNIYHFHFKTGCPVMPKGAMKLFEKIKPSRSCYAGGKQYWISSAEIIELVETTNGLRFKSEIRRIHAADESQNEKKFATPDSISAADQYQLDENSLVQEDDKYLVTDYIFLLMCQMKENSSENPGKEISFGLMCKHCDGHNGIGIFNRSKLATISKNDYFMRLHSHLERCSSCPSLIKSKLNEYRGTHDFQKRQLKRGNRKIFLSRILNRINKAKR